LRHIDKSVINKIYLLQLLYIYIYEKRQYKQDNENEFCENNDCKIYHRKTQAVRLKY
jgi:hypothetical protein